MGSVHVWQILMWRVQKQEMNVGCHLHFLLKCHLNVTCLVVCAMSIWNVPIDMWFFSSQVTFEIVCDNWRVVLFMHNFVCQVSITCGNFVKTHTGYEVYAYVTWKSTSWLKVYTNNLTLVCSCILKCNIQYLPLVCSITSSPCIQNAKYHLKCPNVLM